MPEVDLERIEADARATIAAWAGLCHRCRAGFPGECVAGFNPDTACSETKPTIVAVRRAEAMIEMIEGLDPDKKPKRKREPAAEVNVPAADFERRGAVDSGYIHPDAFRYRKDIGTMADPVSTGRKLAAELYPPMPGQVCEWAMKRNCGGGVTPIMGCIGHPASDIHHGPDKNTLNNEKGSRGVGVNDNVWVICSFCHNAWHAANNVYYPKRDYVADQAMPWLPIFPEGWEPAGMEDATIEEIMAEEERRRREHERHGIRRHGRNARNDEQPGDDVGWFDDDPGDDLGPAPRGDGVPERDGPGDELDGDDGGPVDPEG